MTFLDKHKSVLADEENRRIRHMQQNAREHKEELSKAEAWLKYTRPASPQDLANFLREYLARGGKVTHHYGYNMPANIRVAENSFNITPLYGVNHVVLIVPEEVNISGVDVGHNTILRLPMGPGATFVPCYDDVAALI